jgi:hypothetical protein
VSDSSQVRIGVVAEGQNHHQTGLRSTKRHVDQARPFDWVPQQPLASRDHWIEDDSVILGALRPMHGADRDLGLPSVPEKSFDHPPLCSIRSQDQHVLLTDLAGDRGNYLSDILGGLVACANAILRLSEVALPWALFEVHAVGCRSRGRTACVAPLHHSTSLAHFSATINSPS